MRREEVSHKLTGSSLVTQRVYKRTTACHCQLCPSLISLMVSVDVKHHDYLLTLSTFIVQELCESRGGRPELSVLTSLLASVDVKIY